MCRGRGSPRSSVLLMCLLLSSSLKDDLEEESAVEGDHPGRLWVSVPPALELTPWWSSRAGLRGAGSPCRGGTAEPTLQVWGALQHRRSPRPCRCLQTISAASASQGREPRDRLLSRGTEKACLHRAVTTYTSSNRMSKGHRTYCNLKIIYCQEMLTIS